MELDKCETTNRKLLNSRVDDMNLQILNCIWKSMNHTLDYICVNDCALKCIESAYILERGDEVESDHNVVVVVVCPLQSSSSVNSGCMGAESSILVLSRWACPLSSQVTDNWGELCNRTGVVHPVDPFHSLDNLKNRFASFAFCRNSEVYNVQNGTGIELFFLVWVKRSPRH